MGAGAPSAAPRAASRRPAQAAPQAALGSAPPLGAASRAGAAPQDPVAQAVARAHSPAPEAHARPRDPEPQSHSGADALVELDEEDMGWAASVCADARGRAVQAPRARGAPAQVPGRQVPEVRGALRPSAASHATEPQAGSGAGALVELAAEDMGGAAGACAGARGAALPTPRARSAPSDGPQGPAQGVRNTVPARVQPQDPASQDRGAAQRLAEPAEEDAGCAAGACMDAKGRALQVLRARGAHPTCRQACMAQEKGRRCTNALGRRPRMGRVASVRMHWFSYPPCTHLTICAMNPHLYTSFS